MARNLTAGVITELNAASIRPVHFVEAVFSGGTFRFWSGVGDITWDGETWTGAGNLLDISPVLETTLVRANGVIIKLSGINSSVLAAVLGQTEQSKTVKCWVGFLDSSDNVIIDPYNFFTGFLDLPEIREGPKTSTVTIGAESELIELLRARNRRYTNEDQLTEFPTDKGFSFVAFLKTWNGTWGTGFETSDSFYFDIHYVPPPPPQHEGVDSGDFGDDGEGPTGGGEGDSPGAESDADGQL